MAEEGTAAQALRRMADSEPGLAARLVLHQALKRRMAPIGIEIPPPEELMPGPVDFGGLAERRVLAAEVAP